MTAKALDVHVSVSTRESSVIPLPGAVSFTMDGVTMVFRGSPDDLAKFGGRVLRALMARGIEPV